MKTAVIRWSKPRGRWDAWEMRGRGAGGREYVVTRRTQPSGLRLKSGALWLYWATLNGRPVVSSQINFPDAWYNHTSIRDIKQATEEEEGCFVTEELQAAGEGAGE